MTAAHPTKGELDLQDTVSSLEVEACERNAELASLRTELVASQKKCGHLEWANGCYSKQISELVDALASARERCERLEAAIDDVATHRNSWIGLISELHSRLLLDEESNEADRSYVQHELNAAVRDLGLLIAAREATRSGGGDDTETAG